MCHRFGIVTAPKNVDLPDSVYDIEELQNKKVRSRKRKNRTNDRGGKRQKRVSRKPFGRRTSTDQFQSDDESASESETEQSASNSEFDDSDRYDSDVDDEKMALDN